MPPSHPFRDPNAPAKGITTNNLSIHQTARVGEVRISILGRGSVIVFESEIMPLFKLLQDYLILRDTPEMKESTT